MHDHREINSTLKQHKQDITDSKALIHQIFNAKNTQEIESIVSSISNEYERETIQKALEKREKSKFEEVYLDRAHPAFLNRNFYHKYFSSEEIEASKREFGVIQELLHQKNKVLFLNLSNYESIHDIGGSELSDQILGRFMELIESFSDRLIFLRKGGDEFLFFGEEESLESFIEYIYSDEFKEKLNELIPDNPETKEKEIITVPGVAKTDFDIGRFEEPHTFKAYFSRLLDQLETDVLDDDFNQLYDYYQTSLTDINEKEMLREFKESLKANPEMISKQCKYSETEEEAVILFIYTKIFKNKKLAAEYCETLEKKKVDDIKDEIKGKIRDDFLLEIGMDMILDSLPYFRSIKKAYDYTRQRLKMRKKEKSLSP